MIWLSKASFSSGVKWVNLNDLDHLLQSGRWTSWAIPVKFLNRYGPHHTIISLEDEMAGPYWYGGGSYRFKPIGLVMLCNWYPGDHTFFCRKVLWNKSSSNSAEDESCFCDLTCMLVPVFSWIPQSSALLFSFLLLLLPLAQGVKASLVDFGVGMELGGVAVTSKNPVHF